MARTKQRARRSAHRQPGAVQPAPADGTEDEDEYFGGDQDSEGGDSSGEEFELGNVVGNGEMHAQVGLHLLRPLEGRPGAALQLPRVGGRHCKSARGGAGARWRVRGAGRGGRSPRGLRFPSPR